jgi:cytochrome c-type biogenesis protein CcmH
MLMFWIGAALMGAAAVGLVLWRAARTPEARDEAPDQAVYARQLAELDEQHAQGLMDEAAWKASRAEAGRRLLAAAGRSDASADAGAAGKGGARDRLWVLVGAVCAVLVGVGLYAAIGRPGAPDMPFAARLKRWEAVFDNNPRGLAPAEAAAVLERRVAEQPAVALNWARLGQAYMNARQPMLAAQAFQKAADLAPQDARIWSALGESLTLIGDGRVGPDARAAFVHALKLDPGSAPALFWLGREEMLQGHRDKTLLLWGVLAKTLPPGSPQQAELNAQLERIRTGAADPAQAQAQAVAQAAPRDQAAMIRGMVAGLAQRLDAKGGTPQEWARLVRAYTVLGDTAARDRVLAKARQVFAGRPQDLKVIEAAAVGAPPS